MMTRIAPLLTTSQLKIRRGLDRTPKNDSIVETFKGDLRSIYQRYCVNATPRADLRPNEKKLVRIFGAVEI
jgi:hypothetical protein